MKKILTILTILISATCFGQTKTLVNPALGNNNSIYHYGAIGSDSVDYKVSGCGVPTINMLPYMAKKRGSAEYIDTCANLPYYYSPSTNTWYLGGGGSGGQNLIFGATLGSGTYNGSAPLGPVDADTINYIATKNDLASISNSDSGAITYIVDSIANAPLGTETNGTKYLVGTSPTGLFASHANAIATLTGGVWGFVNPTNNQQVIVDNATNYQTFQYNQNTTTWVSTSILWRVSGNSGIGQNAWIGRQDNKSFIVRIHNHEVARFTTDSTLQWTKFKNQDSSLVYFTVDANGKQVLGHFVPQIIYVDSVSTNAGGDSLIVYKNSIRYAYKLPSGGSGSTEYVKSGTYIRVDSTGRNYTVNADTLGLSTRAWRQKGIDSVVSLIPSLTGYVNAIAGENYLSKSGSTITANAVNLSGTNVTSILPIAKGGTGTATPSLVAGTNVTVTGTFPNQTINATGSSIDTSHFRNKFSPSIGDILGTSIDTAFSCHLQIGVYVYTASDTAAGNTYRNTAQAGDSILQQIVLFVADPNRALYDYVIIDLGANDLNPAITAATKLAQLQSLIDTIHALGKPTVKIIICTINPLKQRLIDVYGSTNGALAYQKYLDMNYAIMGGGSNKILRVDWRINDYNIFLSDSAGNLALPYDCGDHVHQTNTASAVMAAAWRNALNQLGFLLVADPVNVLTPAFTNGVNNQIQVSQSLYTKGYSNFTYNDTTGVITETSSQTAQAMKLNNSSTTGQPAFTATNDASNVGAFLVNGSAYVQGSLGTPWRNDALLYATKSLMLLASAGVTTGGADSIKFTAGGLNNAPTMIMTNGVLNIAGATVNQTSSSSAQLYTQTNSSSGGQAGFKMVNNNSAQGLLIMNGSGIASQGVTWANNVMLYSTNDLILGAGWSGGSGTGKVVIEPQGFSTTPIATFGTALTLNATPATNSEASPAILMRNASSGNMEQRKISVAQTTLVSGTKAITITGLTTGSIAMVTLVTPSGTTLTTQYQAVCTSNTLTIQANVAAGTINTADGSTLNYEVWF